MKINDFSVSVLMDGSPITIDSDSEYVTLPHETEYSIVLANERYTKCDAEVFIDSKSVGTFRIDRRSSCVIDRPANEARRFLFVQETSGPARECGAVAGRRENGLIKVVFTPEVMYRGSRDPIAIDESRRGSMNYSGPRTQSAGVTILGSSSRQTFDQTSAIRQRDMENQTTINLRLVAGSRSSQYAPLVAATGKILSNPEPRRI